MGFLRGLTQGFAGGVKSRLFSRLPHRAAEEMPAPRRAVTISASAMTLQQMPIKTTERAAAAGKSEPVSEIFE